MVCDSRLEASSLSGRFPDSLESLCPGRDPSSEVDVLREWPESPVPRLEVGTGISCRAISDRSSGQLPDRPPQTGRRAGRHRRGGVRRALVLRAPRRAVSTSAAWSEPLSAFISSPNTPTAKQGEVCSAQLFSHELFIGAFFSFNLSHSSSFLVCCHHPNGDQFECPPGGCRAVPDAAVPLRFAPTAYPNPPALPAARPAAGCPRLAGVAPTTA